MKVGGHSQLVWSLLGTKVPEQAEHTFSVLQRVQNSISQRMQVESSKLAVELAGHTQEV